MQTWEYKHIRLDYKGRCITQEINLLDKAVDHNNSIHDWSEGNYRGGPNRCGQLCQGIQASGVSCSSSPFFGGSSTTGFTSIFSAGHIIVPLSSRRNFECGRSSVSAFCDFFGALYDRVILFSISSLSSILCAWFCACVCALTFLFSATYSRLILCNVLSRPASPPFKRRYKIGPIIQEELQWQAREEL